MKTLKKNYYVLITMVFMFWNISLSCSRKTIINNSGHNEYISILSPIDTFSFSSPIFKFCHASNNAILAIDVGLEKIYRINIYDVNINGNLVINIDTIVLPQKFKFLKGIIADNFYIYGYSENMIFQYDLITHKIMTKFNNNKIKIRNLALTVEGEIYILDDFNQQIFYIDNLGGINKFNITASNLFMPIDLTYDIQDNALLIMNKARNSIESYSKIGNRQSIIKLPNQYFTNLKVSKDKIYIWQNNDHFLYRTTKKENTWQGFYIDKPITDFTVLDNLLFVLSGFSKIYIYQLP
ncbi:MAG: hypothetical protein ABIK33_02400 [candidate division WOR-3 bacterium]